jgi:hypothetical protein
MNRALISQILKNKKRKTQLLSVNSFFFNGDRSNRSYISIFPSTFLVAILMSSDLIVLLLA